MITKSKIEELFVDFLPKETIVKIINNYEDYKDATLTQLGVDSLSIMGLVLKIEEIYSIEINFEAFDISSIETLNKMEEFIKKSIK